MAEDGPRVKRFKHESYPKSLKDIHLPSVLSSSKFDDHIDDNDSHFHDALHHWSQLNLSPDFIKFSKAVSPISASMALLLHNSATILDHWLEAVNSADGEGLKPLLDLLQHLTHDLRTSLSPSFSPLLDKMLQLLPRALPAPTLSTLLSTLSSLFATLLVPMRTPPTRVSTTWKKLREVLPKAHLETQRAVAEVWGAVLRRLKGDQRTEAAQLVAADADGIEDAAAWIFVYACKSVSHTLHTSTGPILATLLESHLGSQGVAVGRNERLLRRVLTSLAHHVQNANQYAPVGDLLVDSLTTADEGDNNERFERMLDVLITPCSVRQGSRINATQLTTICKTLTTTILTSPKITADNDFKISPPVLLHLASALILNPDTPHTAYVPLLDAIFDSGTDPALAGELAGVLGDARWVRWRIEMGERVLGISGRIFSLDGEGESDGRMQVDGIEEEGEDEKEKEKWKAVSILRRVVLPRKIGDASAVWRHRVGEWVHSALDRWRLGHPIERLKDILALSVYAKDLAPKLTPLVDALLALEVGADPKVVAACIQELARRPEEWGLLLLSHEGASGEVREEESRRSRVDVVSWVGKCVQMWAGDEDVLGALVALLGVCDLEGRIGQRLANLHVYIRDSVLSHKRGVRLNALRLLSVSCSSSSSTPHETKEVIRRCLQGEEVPIDLGGVRMRVMKIGRVVQGLYASISPKAGTPRVEEDKRLGFQPSQIGSPSSSSLAVDSPWGTRDGDAGLAVGVNVCARWLIAQLKANLRPLWSPAIGALASLAEKHGEAVWELVFRELSAACGGLVSEGGEDGEGKEDGGSKKEEERDGELDEEEREDEVTWRDPSAYKLRVVVKEWIKGATRETDSPMVANERFDPHSYALQLLSSLTEFPSFAEKHNRDLIPFFLSLSTPRIRIPKSHFTAWLALLSKFTNPKSLTRSGELRSLYLDLLAHPDRAIQRAALACLCTYKSPAIVACRESLNALLDEVRWRDELASLDLRLVVAEGEGGREDGREEIVGVVVRLLFGMMLERKGRSRGAERRTAVLSALGGCEESELGLLVELMMRPLGVVDIHASPSVCEMSKMGEGVKDKQMLGFLTLLGDVLKNLGPRLVRWWAVLVGITVDIVATAQRRIDSGGNAANGDQENAEEPNEEDEDEAILPSGPSPKMTRTLRQLGLKRLGDFFRSPVDSFDFSPFMGVCFKSFISPRLVVLDKENSQAPSALLELFYAWAQRPEYARLLVEYDERVMSMIYACLVVPGVKPAVVVRVLDIVESLLSLAGEDEWVADKLMKPHVSLLLRNLSVLVERIRDVASVASTLGQRQIGILSEIAQYSTDGGQASMLLTLFSPLLRKPAKMVPEKVKVDLLKIITNLLPLIDDLGDSTSAVYIKSYKLFSQLFQSLRTRNARLYLVGVFRRFAAIDGSLERIAGLLGSLNAYCSKRIEEPDFDSRLAAFTSLNESLFKTLSAREWLPVIYHLLYSIQDQAELAIRNNASFGFKNFIDLVATSDPELKTLFLQTLYPGLKNGLHSKSELVRAEILGVLAYAVTKCENLEVLREMRSLLEGGDEEANFFNNIFHIQIHRRSRALRRLADHCDEGHLRNSTLAEIFLPLVTTFIVSPSTVDHNLLNEAITTTGRVSKQLAWGAYNAVLQKYLKLSREKDTSERIYVRTLVAILDNFHFPMDEIANVEAQDAADVEDEETEGTVAPEPPVPNSQVTKIADAVNSRLLPSLLHHLEKHDKTTDDNTRIPIAVGIVKVAMHLPLSTKGPQITRLITILSQILRSKSQETRDLTRDTLTKIAITLGPSYLQLVFRELRAALVRGPQLHVLAYVVHSMLVQVTTGQNVETFHTLDDCVSDIAQVSAEVIFGQSGKDVQVEEFKTTMREVRAASSSGLDSFTITAKFIAPTKLTALLAPLKAIMHETEAVKVMNLVDEVIKRITSGLAGNKHLTPAELLVLCHTLISQNARFLQQTPRKQMKGAKNDIVLPKRQLHTESDHFENNSFRFVVLGLDLFETALRRNKFDVRDEQVLARMESMVSVVGNTLYSTSTPVLILGLKAASGLMRCPLKSLEKSAPVFVRQIIDVVQSIGSADSDIVQTCFKSLSVIIRDGQNVQVKEKDLTYLLELLSPDLEEPNRQTSVFAMLKAIVSRKFIVPEIYDLMEKVSEVMVTSQSPQVREQCRSIFLQLLLDYPQGKGRLKNQMTFLAKNLTYVHDSGRQSVMELLSAVFYKFEINLVREYGDLFFVALVMVIVNDDSAKCREMASELIKTLITRFDDDRQRVMLSHLHSWASQHSKPQLVKVSSQIYGLFVEVLQAISISFIPAILDDTNSALGRCARNWTSINENDSMELDVDWEVPYHTLILTEKILSVFPDLITQPGKVIWPSVFALLLFPHAWVRAAASRLLGLLFGAVPSDSPPLSSPASSLPLDRDNMIEVGKSLCAQLKSDHLDNVLAAQIVKNLFFVGKSFYAIPVKLSITREEEPEAIEDNEKVTIFDEAKRQNPLPWLFSTLSYQTRSSHIARRNASSYKANWTLQPSSILKWFAAMASHMDASHLEQFLIHILTPIFRIVEEDIINDSQIGDLKTLATEVQDLVKQKVGTTAFSNVYNKIRQGALSIRRDRKIAKATQATKNPEAAAKHKLHRNVHKKDSRKRKNRQFNEQNGKTRGNRET